jgi:hypothetical protein
VSSKRDFLHVLAGEAHSLTDLRDRWPFFPDHASDRKLIPPVSENDTRAPQRSSDSADRQMNAKFSAGQVRSHEQAIISAMYSGA